MFIYLYQWQARHKSYLFDTGQNWAMNDAHLYAQLIRDDKYIFTKKLIAIKWLVRYSTQDQAVFFKKLYTLIHSGFQLIPALQALEKQEKNRDFKRFLQHAQQLIAAGHPLSTAMQHHSYFFDALSIALIKAGEHSGRLPQVCARLSEHTRQHAQWHQEMQRACFYPASILLLGCILVFLLMHFILPQTLSLYADSAHEIPKATQILSTIYTKINTHFLIVVSAFIVAMTGFWRLKHMVLPHIPWFKTIYQLQQNTHFIYTLTLCYSSGVPVRHTLRLAMTCLHQTQKPETTSYLLQALDEGHALSAPLKLLQILPEFVVDMIHIGENTGAFEKMSYSAGQWLEAEVKHKITLTLKIIEPALLIFLGAVIALLMIAFYLPLFSLAELAV